MKILMIAHTNDEEGLHEPGQVIDVRDEIATDYLNRGLALPYKEDKVERATVSKPETATGHPQKSESHHKPAVSEAAKREHSDK